jgi:hypothetical protein
MAACCGCTVLIVRRSLSLSVALAALLGAGASQAQPSVEYAVKAAYLAKFAPFIEWPEGAFAGPAAPLTICILGPDPFGGDLDKAIAGQKDGDHPIVARRLPAPDPAIGCHILFSKDQPLAEQALAEMKTRPVVTVTDSGLRAHGVISFLVIDNHVRFDIDDAAADSVDINISSKLLGLAHAVRQKAPR